MVIVNVGSQQSLKKSFANSDALMTFANHIVNLTNLEFPGRWRYEQACGIVT